MHNAYKYTHTLRVGCLIESWIALPLESTVLPSASRISGVGFAGGSGLVHTEREKDREREGGREGGGR